MNEEDRKGRATNWIVYAIVAMTLGLVYFTFQDGYEPANYASHIVLNEDTVWTAPSLYTDNTLHGEDRALVVYGEELVAQTARYFGPQGSINPIANGMNCQNCHLNAGKKAWGNNYGAVASTYPRFRERSGTTESVAKRINDCFERSLNGVPLDTNSHEMKAMLAYINWVGNKVPKGEKPATSGIRTLRYLDRAADPLRGKKVYDTHCLSCHGANGDGQKEPGSTVYFYPPLWGPDSYNNGAGLFRLSRFAGYVYDNMPFNTASHNAPVLSTEEAWDVAAFVNSQPRPSKELKQDWPDITKKPIDHPFGPYHDGFTEQQHKYGPFPPIENARVLQAEKK